MTDENRAYFLDEYGINYIKSHTENGYEYGHYMSQGYEYGPPLVCKKTDEKTKIPYKFKIWS